MRVRALTGGLLGVVVGAIVASWVADSAVTAALIGAVWAYAGVAVADLTEPDSH